MSMGSTANITGLIADALPRVLNPTALPVIANANPTLHAFMGQPLQPQAIDTDVPDSMPNMPAFKNLNVGFSGSQFEYRLLMAVDQPDFVGYLDPADPYAAANWSYQEKRAAAKGNFARLTLPYSFDAAKLDLIAGDQAKCTSFLNEERVAIAEGFEQKLGNAIHGSGDQTDKSISGWQLALGGATGTYLNIDMSDPDNVNFTANTHNVAGTMNFKHIGIARNKSVSKKGRPNLAICTETDMNGIEQIVEGKYTLIDNDETWRKFEGQYILVKGIRFVLDAYHPASGTIPYIDTRYVTCFMKSMGFSLNGQLQRLPQFQGVMGAFIDMYFGVIYNNLKTCVRQYGISAYA